MRGLVEKSEGKRPLCRPRGRLAVIHKEISRKGVNRVGETSGVMM